MDENLFYVNVEVNLTNYSQVKLEKRLYGVNLFVVQQRAPVHIYVTNKYFTAAQIVTDSEVLQIVLYLQQKPDDERFARFAPRQIAEMADYCKFHQLVHRDAGAYGFGKSSIVIALEQKLQLLEAGGIERYIWHAQHYYRAAIAQAEQRLQMIRENEASEMEAHKKFIAYLREAVEARLAR